MIKKDIKEIKEKLDKLTSDTIYKAKEYDNLVNLLSNLFVSVAKSNPYWDEKDMRFNVKVEYEIPPVILKADDDGELLLNERFRAINLLNLISYNDMDKISIGVEKMNKLNKGGEKK